VSTQAATKTWSTPAEDRRLLIPEEGSGHTYTLGGRPLYGVTHVIHTVLRAPQLEEWFKRMGTRADAIRDEAADFGKSIHAGLAAHVGGARLIPMGLPPAWEQTVEAGRQWLDANLEEVYATEQAIASAKYGYAGKPDVYGRRVGRKMPCLIDFKTTKDIYWSHRFQLAAYRKAATETYGDKPAERIVLLFSKDEPGKVTAHVLKHHDADFAGWGYCLGLYGVMQTGVKA
jgi:hypothetical protein